MTHGTSNNTHIRLDESLAAELKARGPMATVARRDLARYYQMLREMDADPFAPWDLQLLDQREREERG